MATPRWLDDTEQEAWRGFLGVSVKLLDALDHDLQRDHDMTLGDYEVLAQLSESPGDHMRMATLAERARVSRSRLSHQVKRLVDRGWVERQSCPSDKRGVEAVLTPEGRRVLEAAAPGHVAGVRCHLFDQLTPEQVKAMADAFAIVRQGLEQA